MWAIHRPSCTRASASPLLHIQLLFLSPSRPPPGSCFWFSFFLVKFWHRCLIRVNCLCLRVGGGARGPHTRVCVACARDHKRSTVTKCLCKWVCQCVMCNQFASVYLTHLAGHRMRWQFGGSRGCVLCGADRHLNTYLYAGLRFTVDPCRPFFSYSLPPTPPRCASLRLPLLSCFKSSSFSLSVISPVPPLSGSLPPFPLLHLHCLAWHFLHVFFPLEWVAGVSSRPQVVAEEQLWLRPDKQHVYALCVFLCVSLRGDVWRNGGETEEGAGACNWTLAVRDEAFSK